VVDMHGMFRDRRIEITCNIRSNHPNFKEFTQIHSADFDSYFQNKQQYICKALEVTLLNGEDITKIGFISPIIYGFISPIIYGFI